MDKFLTSIVNVILILTKSAWFMELKSMMELEPDFDTVNNVIEVGDKHKGCRQIVLAF